MYIRFSPRIQKDKSIELAENITFCITVFIICILIFGSRIKEFAQYLLLSDAEKTKYLINNPDFNYLDFIVNYTGITVLVSILIIGIWYSIGKRGFCSLINFINKLFDRPVEQESSDIWRNLFETDKIIKKYECCIVIEKSGNMITAGLLHSFQPPHLDDKELLLYNTEQIKEIFKEDTEKSPNNRIFYPALYEYYDASADLLMKFYSIDKLKKKWYPHSKT